jgi:transcriptional regulator with XRE-family HTH domain/predicted transcriptional regulator
MFNNNDSVRLIFGLKIKTLRQQQGLNFQQLSKVTDIAVSYLHDIENGKKYPKADKIITLAKALKVDYDYLVSLNATKRLQPIIELLNSDFMNVIPWSHFGLNPSSLLELFANTPDKVTAFISTLLKLSRSVQMSKENFYTSALRSFQDIHDNYFEELETASRQFRVKAKMKDALPVNAEIMELNLKKHFDIIVDRSALSHQSPLQEIRSYYSICKKVLYLNKGLTVTQEKFLIGREIAFQFLNLQPRPYQTMVQDAESFDVLLNNFKASYFSSALLMPEDIFTEDIRKITSSQKWTEKSWVDLIAKYDVTPEMLMQRLTNILPSHFGIDQLFFLRMSGTVAEDYYDMTKELHLSQLHNPYANALNEHYCRRWVAISSMQEVHDKMQNDNYKSPVIQAQTSQYWQTHNRYFCLSFAKPIANSDKISSVTIGILIDSKSIQTLPFINDHTVPVRTVHTTCERCGIMDCRERIYNAVFIEKDQVKNEVEQALKLLDNL